MKTNETSVVSNLILCTLCFYIYILREKLQEREDIAFRNSLYDILTIFCIF